MRVECCHQHQRIFHVLFDYLAVRLDTHSAFIVKRNTSITNEARADRIMGDVFDGAIGVDTLKRRDATGRRRALEAHLQTLRNGVIDVADALTTRYLSHSLPSRLTTSA